MKRIQPQILPKQTKEQGWTTMEMLITFPLLIAELVMCVYFGMLMYTKLTLEHATNAAVQALAKTKDCGLADSYFNSNFTTGGAHTTCSAGDDMSTYTASYDFNDIPLMMVVIPPTKLNSVAKAVTEKVD